MHEDSFALKNDHNASTVNTEIEISTTESNVQALEQVVGSQRQM